MKYFGFLIAFLLPLVWGSVVVSQDLTLAPGARVRVTAQDLNISRSIGEVERVDPDTLVINLETSQMAIPMAAVQRIDISRGLKSNTLKGTLYGALAGGLAFGTVAGVLIEGDDFWGLGVFIYAVSGLAAGAGLGALIGSGWHTEHWNQVPLPVSLSVAPLGDGDYAVGVAFRYNIPIGQ